MVNLFFYSHIKSYQHNTKSSRVCANPNITILAKSANTFRSWIMAFPGGYLVLWAPMVINYARIRNIGNVWYGGIKSVLLLVVYVWLMV